MNKNALTLRTLLSSGEIIAAPELRTASRLVSSQGQGSRPST